MPYDNLPGVRATYPDGSLRIPRGTSQPKILVLGAALSGSTNELFNVTSVSQAENEFGASSEMFKHVHEAVALGADNVAVMRVGGTKGSVTITDSNGKYLSIEPQRRDDTVLARYALVIDGSGTKNRILIWDLDDEEWVYDSSEILVINDGIVEVVNTGLGLFSIGTIDTVSTYVALEDLVTGSFTAEGSATISTVTSVEGTDGSSMTLPERYAALNAAYHLLDYRDADFVVPASAYLDSPNLATPTASVEAGFFKGLPVAGASNDALGFLWQYIYKGQLYTYFTDMDDYFSVAQAAATVTVNTDLVLTAVKTGVGGNEISIEIDAAGAAGPTVTISEASPLSLEILVEDDGSSTTGAAVTAINLALAAFTMSNGQLASTIVGASGVASTLLTTVAATSLASGTGGSVLTHEMLTGEAVPSAVSTRFAAGSDAELRECNFAHQLASFCHHASKTWKAISGSISTLAPEGLSRNEVSEWIGSPPLLSVSPDGQQDIIDSSADNGSGILGNKFLAGEAASGGGYRNSAIVDAASVTDGLAFGGFVKTKGLSLPNADDYPEHSYGVDSDDELLDVNKRPVDIGKHIYVSYDYPIHRNGYNGGSSYRGPVNVTFLAKLISLPENEEPIGTNGVVGSVTSVPKIHATQLDKLARQRTIGLRREEGIGLIFITARTAAHPTSDYTRASTMRCVNKELQGIRNIAKDYIGKEFSAQKLIALQSAIEGFLQAERILGFNAGSKVALSYTRGDKILGKLKIRVRMVPPFSIETIDVEMSMAADETEL